MQTVWFRQPSDQSKWDLVCVFVCVYTCVCPQAFLLEEVYGESGSATKGRNGNMGHVRLLSGLWVLCLDCTTRTILPQVLEGNLENINEGTSSVGCPEVQVLGRSPTYPGLMAVLSEQSFLHFTFVSPNCAWGVIFKPVSGPEVDTECIFSKLDRILSLNKY